MTKHIPQLETAALLVSVETPILYNLFLFIVALTDVKCVSSGVDTCTPLCSHKSESTI